MKYEELQRGEVFRLPEWKRKSQLVLLSLIQTSYSNLCRTSRHIGDTNTVKFYMARRREESTEVSPAFGLLFH